MVNLSFLNLSSESVIALLEQNRKSLILEYAQSYPIAFPGLFKLPTQQL